MRKAEVVGHDGVEVRKPLLGGPADDLERGPSDEGPALKRMASAARRKTWVQSLSFLGRSKDAREETRLAVGDKQSRMTQIESLVSSDGTLEDSCRLSYYWVVMELPLYIEIVVFLFLAFYIDVILDIKTIWIFIEGQDFKYAVLNVFAIVSANLYTFVNMLRTCPEGDPRWLLAVGYLTPFYGHIFVLCIMSLRDGKKHKLLYSGKLAEAALEAFISSLVQTYALIYSTWEGKDDKRFAVILSVCSSFLSIGYSFTCFDCRDGGLEGVPGRLNGFDYKMALVLFVRVAEVASRITSLAMISVCTRGIVDTAFAEEYPQPFKMAVENFLLTAGPSILLLDLCVLALITYLSRRNPLHAIPSVLCYINPLLELGNPISIRGTVYYAWRAVELFAIGGYISWGKAHGVNDMDELLAQHDDLVMVCISSSALWLLLIPLIRCCLASHAPIRWYEAETFGARTFEKGQYRLVEDLLNNEDPSLRNDMEGVVKETLAVGLHELSSSIEEDETFDVQIQYSKQGKNNNQFPFGAFPLEHELRIDDLEESDILRWNDKNGAHALKQNDRIFSVDGRRGTAEELLTQIELSKGTVSLQIRRPKEDVVKPLPPRTDAACLRSLYAWGERTVNEHKRAEAEERRAERVFSNVLIMCSNLGLRKHSCVTREQQLDLLRKLARAMAVSRSVLDTAVGQMRLFKNILPILPILPNAQWDSHAEPAPIGPADRKQTQKNFHRARMVTNDLHREKMDIVEKLWKRGWERDLDKDFEFGEQARELLEVTDLQYVTGDDEMPEAFTDKRIWEKFAVTQMRTLVRLWKYMPRPVNDEEKKHAAEELKKDLFRSDRHWVAMVQGARIALAQSRSLWNDEDLLDFCRAVWESQLGSLHATRAASKPAGSKPEGRPSAKEGGELNAVLKAATDVLGAVKKAVEERIETLKEDFRDSLDARQDNNDAEGQQSGMERPHKLAYQALERDLRWIMENHRLYLLPPLYQTHKGVTSLYQWGRGLKNSCVTDLEKAEKLLRMRAKTVDVKQHEAAQQATKLQDQLRHVTQERDALRDTVRKSTVSRVESRKSTWLSPVWDLGKSPRPSVGDAELQGELQSVRQQLDYTRDELRKVTKERDESERKRTSHVSSKPLTPPQSPGQSGPLRSDARLSPPPSVSSRSNVKKLTFSDDC